MSHTVTGSCQSWLKQGGSGAEGDGLPAQMRAHVVCGRTSLELRLVAAHLSSSSLRSASPFPSRLMDSSRTLDTASWQAWR